MEQIKVTHCEGEGQGSCKQRGTSMNTPMKLDELVGALRSCSNPATRKPDCDNCPLFGERLCVKKMLEGAADQIESLRARADQAALNYQQKCRDVVELESKLAESTAYHGI